ncbi:MAG TPA: tryptophan 7-halogenase, partial [Gammaproteobacteria bacterium]
MSDQAVKHVVILGGGSAGWLTAGVIAAEHKANEPGGLAVTLVESPNVAPIGVGEGTWPTMRTTLSKIGVSETEFFRNCEASFKQGIKFVGWVNGAEDDYYYHPLELPRGFNKTDLVSPWQKIRDRVAFADAVCFQGHLCERNLAPKQLSTPEYAHVANYAYHFSSVKLGEFLAKHCTEKLGVRHIVDDVTGIE